MKYDISELNVLTIDYGTFLDVATMFSRKVNESWIYTPYEAEYLDIVDCVKGDGLAKVERIDDFMDPDFLERIDLFVFPDRGYVGLQKYLRSIGKNVWGSFGACSLEESRTLFLKTLAELNMPVAPSVQVRGLSNLAELLKAEENKWVKINRFRNNIETFHHQDFDHSARILDGLSFEFGPLREEVMFVVQDAIDGDDDEPVLEIGYDGWCVQGRFPDESFQGYEKKNQLYLGSKLTRSELPASVSYVNDAFAPVLERYGYCNFWATEIRQKGDMAYFIDPTSRMAGQTQEHLLHTCTNLAEVIWGGSREELISPVFANDFAAAATLHYTDDTKDGWRSLRVPDEVRPHTSLYHFCYYDGLYHFPKGRNDEIGVVFGTGDTIEEAFENLKGYLDVFKGQPVRADIEGFAELLTQVQDAEEEGLEFAKQEIPDPSTILDNGT